MIGSTDESRQIISGYGERVVPVLKEKWRSRLGIQCRRSGEPRAIFYASSMQMTFFCPEKVARVVEVFRQQNANTKSNDGASSVGG